VSVLAARLKAIAVMVVIIGSGRSLAAAGFEHAIEDCVIAALVTTGVVSAAGW
jgi:hypothetical protein